MRTFAHLHLCTLVTSTHTRTHTRTHTHTHTAPTAELVMLEEAESRKSVRAEPPVKALHFVAPVHAVKPPPEPPVNAATAPVNGGIAPVNGGKAPVNGSIAPVNGSVAPINAATLQTEPPVNEGILPLPSYAGVEGGDRGAGGDGGGGGGGGGWGGEALSALSGHTQQGDGTEIRFVISILVIAIIVISSSIVVVVVVVVVVVIICNIYTLTRAPCVKS